MGPVAMLASTLNMADFDHVISPSYAMSEKIDGYRLLVTTGPDGPGAFNRAGAPAARGLPKNLQPVFGSLENHAVFDGEYARGVLYLFDLPVYDDVVSHATPWARRQLALRKLLDLWSPPDDAICYVAHVRAGEEKLELLRRLQDEGGEGVVAKRLDSTYQPGPLPSRAWLRHKFLSEVDVVVVDTGHEGKNNLVLAMADPAGDILIPGGSRGREVGRCSALTGDGPHIHVGDVVTVTVTGLGPSGRLVEPVTPRLRGGDDKTPAACTIDQLDALRGISR